ncbi:MAG: FtsX-like permease family protein [Bacteroidota bacterium]
MLKNYFKIALRKLKKNKLYATVNIAGLMIGITSCILIGLYISHELSYDRFNKNGDRIVRVTTDYNFGDAPEKTALTGTKAGPQFKRTFPSVKDFARIYKRTRVVGFENKVFEEKNFLYADSSLLSMFSFPLSEGDASTALNAPGKIVITQTAAKKYFGNQEAVGKVLKVGDADFQITGITADAPSNSVIQFDFIASFASLDDAGEEHWMDANYNTYLLLNSEQSIAPLQTQVTQYMKDVSKNELKKTGANYLTFHIEPLTSVHLHSALSGFEPNSSIVYIYVLAAVALLILVIACVNYVNLSTAQSAGRGGEISMRKILGAEKKQIFSQFIGESFIIAMIAMILALGTAWLLLPYFNNLSGKQFQAPDLLNPYLLIALVILGIIISFASGSYPAFLLSNLKLIKVMKSGFSFTSGAGVRKSLIIFQFVISIFLVVSTIIILQQLHFIRNKDLGYNKNNIVVLPLDDKTSERFDALKTEMSSLPQIQSITAARQPVNVEWGDQVEGEHGEAVTVNVIPSDEDFVKTFGVKIIAGTDFTKTDVMQMDTSNDDKNLQYSFMLNESAVKAFGWKPENAIGRRISRGKPGIVKAVVKDFHFHSLHEPITPLLIFLDNRRGNSIFIKISSADIPLALGNLKKVWNARVTHRPFEYHFLDETYDALYKSEQQTAGVFTTFSVMAILLACLGLFALTAYAVVQRTKEIGIRKVLGANIPDVVVLLSKDFLLLVGIAIIIASPIAWWAMHRWLEDFAYRINIAWWIFAAAGAMTLVIALVTISLQAIKTALANPVKSLRSE